MQADAEHYTKIFMKAFLERAMNHFLQEEKQGLTSTNSCNGYTSKSVTTNHGTVRVTCPGDRPGCSVPLIIPNNQTFRWF
ncbi:transposase [Sutterella wadsworthensis]|nr:transposase [Sutterella wadsworthensis]